MYSCFIGVGSNLNDPVRQNREAWIALAGLPGTERVNTSSLYRSAPMGPADQPAYINSVVHLSTELAALDLLDALQEIERQQGRVRSGQRWSARTLDLDLLLYDRQVLTCQRLTVPHPGITQRSFVLLPLLEICPRCELPGLGPAGDFVGSADDYAIQKLQEYADDGT